MKIILSGATGFIGGATLQRLVNLPTVTSIIALSRRELPIKDPKVETVIIKDFTIYDDATLAKFEGAEAIIWCLGSPTSGIDVHDGYTMAAVNVAVQTLAPKLSSGGKKLRFIYLSGHLVERDQNKTVWIPGLGKLLKARGLVETKILDLQTQHPDSIEAWVARPSLVTKGESIVRFITPSMYIPVDVLGAALADAAVNGDGERILQNEDLKSRGKAALVKEK